MHFIALLFFIVCSNNFSHCVWVRGARCYCMATENHCNLKIGQNGVTTNMNMLVFLLYEGLYDCSLLTSLCTIMSHLTFSCISLCHTFSYTQDGATPLYVACQDGHKQTVDVLLKNGAIVNLTRTVSFIEETYGT